MECCRCFTTESTVWFFPDGGGLPAGPALCSACWDARVQLMAEEWDKIADEVHRRLLDSFGTDTPTED